MRPWPHEGARTGRHRLAVLAACLAWVACGGNEPVASDGSGSASAGTGATGTPGALPPTPLLKSPADGAQGVPIQTPLCWEPVTDPDGDEVRYQVVVDGVKLLQGITGDEGYAGPCTPPLTLTHERTYQWFVQAFEAGDPTRTSPPSATWSFTTASDGTSTTVFQDDFGDDLGWTVSGDATSGAWVRGLPEQTYDGARRSQLGRCADGRACYFTGANPDGVPDQADVSGGRTVLTSPAFDLSGAATATVRLARAFYKSDSTPAASFEIELLVPDDGAPGQFVPYLLERLDQPTASEPHNVWTPVEYAACDVPMRADSRLRVTARDDGTGILEAALDSVSVHAHGDTSVCAAGVGGICDPQQGAAACPGDLLCCAQNVRNDGVFRCTAPVAGLDPQDPPASPQDPGNGALGCDAPDLLLDPAQIEPSFADILVTNQTCELLEGCVGGTGPRRLMLFTAAIRNVGSRDLVLGIPANHPDVFHYSPCHQHYHFDEFARYDLRAGDTVVAIGHKQAFCMLDTISWAWPFELPTFDCANQGISRGFTDSYEAGLPCQWIDVTGVAPGDYTLRVELNPIRDGDAYPLLR